MGIDVLLGRSAVADCMAKDEVVDSGACTTSGIVLFVPLYTGTVVADHIHTKHVHFSVLLRFHRSAGDRQNSTEL